VAARGATTPGADIALRASWRINQQAFFSYAVGVANTTALRFPAREQTVGRIAPLKRRSLYRRGQLVRRASGYELQKLKPRYPASASRAARAELPAAIGAYRRPTDFSDEADFFAPLKAAAHPADD
jgi:hypothetical protein